MEATFGSSGALWEWDARNDSSWVFVTLPVDLAEDIGDEGVAIVPAPKLVALATVFGAGNHGRRAARTGRLGSAPCTSR